MYGKRLILMATLALVPASLFAQTGQVDARAAAQASTPEARIEAVMAAAAEAQIPRGLLESKLQEGRAKGVAMERVAAAMEARLNGLVRARAALEQAGIRAASEGELLVAGEAIRLGVSEAALVAVQARAEGGERAVATAVLTDLVRLGIEPGAASARVQAAMQRGPEAMVQLRGEAAAGLRARGEASTRVRAGVNVGRPDGR